MLETIILKEQETDLAACKNISKYAILPAYYYFLKWKEKKKKTNPTFNSAACRKVTDVTNKNIHCVSKLDWIKPKACL